MDDYLSEQEQWEQVKAWVREGWPWFAGAVLVIAGGWQGWKAWQAHQDNGFVAAASEYEQLIRALDANDEAKATSITNGSASHDARHGSRSQSAGKGADAARTTIPAGLNASIRSSPCNFGP